MTTAPAAPTDAASALADPAPLQPLLSDAVIVLRAPTQVWSDRDGAVGTAAVHGIYHGDVRHVRALTASCDDSPIEWISTAPDGPSRVVFGGVLRGVDDTTPDPKVRLLRERTVADGRVAESWTLRSRVGTAIRTTLRLLFQPEFALLHEVKSGYARPQPIEVEVGAGSARVSAGPQGLELTAAGAEVASGPESVEASWAVEIPAFGEVTVTWDLALRDDTLVVGGADAPARWDVAAVAAGAHDPRLARWLTTALGDLDALRLVLPDDPADEFFAAGAPWFFTLFGRDSLWAARLALPLDRDIAASTLRVLARLQGTLDDPQTAQEPGKILHELRASSLEIPSEGISLPPRYYGSVDSTPLWICLLADAWRAGLPDTEVRALLPALRGALGWIRDSGDSDGDGFLDYIDRLGTGLANQGWKDSGDSIQWRDGTLADGPIALCEVQAYAYEAALAGADLLAEFGGEQDAADIDFWREWAADLKTRFAAAYWIETPEGRYPAVALDREKRPVDTLTSNIGHLIGTGILDADDEAHIAELLRRPSMSSGYGIRTMSTDAAGYWPLSYHGGSVWVHDTAIAVHGLRRAGLLTPARAIVDELLDAAEGFAYRVPELHSGDPRSETTAPTPYPAACRPQAWSAAAAVVCLTVVAATD
ncbi:glycogen debranching N-terminal domain-containing protein [Microbacterium sp. RURRCA19A]|uniref:glycogen debranching N-terminal domain-containing protein n=1 Tax=Microbacterium sp. RURRCA19A TaxID=1907391 RepID=UPI000955A2CF|nr:glycogen debranching N-terminal domain-containing protein [Microbacterium sp. RURRCA19A]SIS08893.1 N-terminal domain of (some) glycogen debranching enzymes [Microbacterium sp. RURRCA19A]